jgi:hypothetical protein
MPIGSNVHYFKHPLDQKPFCWNVHESGFRMIDDKDFSNLSELSKLPE